MVYMGTSSLRSAAAGTSAGWARLLRANGADEPDTIATLYFQGAAVVGLNADLALAQGVLETGWFKSDRWRLQRNPAGLGITADDVAGENMQTMERGIRAHLAHLCCYVYTAADCPIERGVGWHDPRHFFHDGTPALEELKGTMHQWATAPDYIPAIVRVANQALESMGTTTASATDDAAVLERAYQAAKERLGAKRFAGLLRRPEFGDGAADAYQMLACERGILIVVGGQARDVTARCVSEAIAESERAGSFQRL